jgi:hypothetical protein
MEAVVLPMVAPLVVEEDFKPSKNLKGESAMVGHLHTQQVCWQYR